MSRCKTLERAAWCVPPIVIGAMLALTLTSAGDASGRAVATPRKAPAPATAMSPRDDAARPNVPARSLESNPKRLLHFQAVGFSSEDAPGRVSPQVCNPVDGWLPHLQNHLEPLIEYLGPDSFDWWGHNTGGVWEDLIPVEINPERETSTLFEQMDVAAVRFPELIDYTQLAAFAAANGIDLYGYIGLPRCDTDNPEFTFTPEPTHCDPAFFDNWYGAFVDFGFKGVGHDFTAALSPTSGVLANNFPMLEAEGLDVYIEAVPWRNSEQHLGQNVVAIEYWWEYAELFSDFMWTEQELNDAGGRTIHLVIRDPTYNVPDIQQWRFLVAKRLLEEGKTVAVPLDQLLNAGYPIEQLVRLSRGLPAELPPALPQTAPKAGGPTPGYSGTTRP
ncbi:MAG: hypothetical protein GY715_14515 [Planctomycetes bacterium]|nr:hypothetical protein [Planctomycetota bacterium]